MFFADMPEKVDRCRAVLCDFYYCAENVDEFGIYVKVNLLKYKRKMSSYLLRRQRYGGSMRMEMSK